MNYINSQLITYLGNKRKLINSIEEIVLQLKEEIDTTLFTTADLFSGSGVVSRMLKQHSHKIIVNDLEYYSYVINKCFLTCAKDINIKDLHRVFNKLVIDIELNKKPSWITQHYSPANDQDIEEGERAFYTNYNALYLDTARELIHKLEEPYKSLFLAPLLSEASKHCNTSGHFKSFYKDKSGIAKFGGEGESSLHRITEDICVQIPILDASYSQIEIHQRNTNDLVRELEHVNVIYLDPPYNQHPYASNYFMLNAIAKNEEPQQKSKVSGIPKDWNKSNYNKKSEARNALKDCIEHCKADYLIISYNNEGFISKEELKEDLSLFGELTIKGIDYSAFKASRNLKNRAKKVTEYLFILKKN